MDPEQIALDTSVLCRPYDRRFVMAAWQLLGAKVAVLPRVARELHGTMADSERQHWRRVMDGEEERGREPYTTLERYRIARAAADGVRQWVEAELDAQLEDGPFSLDSALRVVRMGEADRADADDLAMRLPDHCFQGHSKDGHAGDRRIIGEAAVMNFRILASRNRTSIRRERTNAWLREKAGLNADLVCEADDVLTRVHHARHADPDAAALDAVLHAALPKADVTPERQDEIVEAFIGHLRASCFPDCAEGAQSAWLGPEGVAAATRMRERLDPSPSRDTESRRVSAVRNAAAGAGWRPS